LGGWRVTDPVGYFALHEIKLGNDVNMLNEARAAGGMVVASALVIMLGAFLPAMVFTSTVFSVVVFLSFGFARLYGIAADGVLGEIILQGVFFEFVFGSVSVFALYRYRECKSVSWKSRRTGERA
jgi:hypothetical protein